MVVLAVLGLLLALLLGRGPQRSATLDLRAASGAVAQGLRMARSRAIAADRVVAFRLDAPAHGWRLDDGPVQALPADVSAALALPGGAIRFAPDGSASGGTVGLQAGGRRAQVSVDWLTGRVGVGDDG